MEEKLLELATRLERVIEQTAPQVWKLAQRQVMISAVASLVWGVVILLVTYGLWRLLWAWRCRVKEEQECFDSDQVLGWVFGICGLLILGGIGLTCLEGGVARLFNPGWYAIKELAGLIP